MESSLNSDKVDDSAAESNLVCQLRDMLANGASLVEANIALLKLGAKEILLDVSKGFFSIFFGTLLLLLAVSFLMYGLSIGISRLLLVEPWVGFVLVGFVLLIGKLIFSRMMLFLMHQKDAKKKSQFKIAESKDAFLKSSQKVKNTLCQKENFENLVSSYPFSSAGVAGVAGFVLAGELSNKPRNVDSDIAGNTAVSIGLMTLLTSSLGTLLHEALIPALKEHLASKD